MSDPSNRALQTVLGRNLQTGAMRAVLILGAFAFLGACIAWIAH